MTRLEKRHTGQLRVLLTALQCPARHLHNATDGGIKEIYLGRILGKFTSELAHKNLNTTHNWKYRIVKPNKWF